MTYIAVLYFTQYLIRLITKSGTNYTLSNKLRLFNKSVSNMLIKIVNNSEFIADVYQHSLYTVHSVYFIVEHNIAIR